jgi:hypothetical protein
MVYAKVDGVTALPNQVAYLLDVSGPEGKRIYPFGRVPMVTENCDVVFARTIPIGKPGRYYVEILGSSRERLAAFRVVSRGRGLHAWSALSSDSPAIVDGAEGVFPYWETMQPLADTRHLSRPDDEVWGPCGLQATIEDASSEAVTVCLRSRTVLPTDIRSHYLVRLWVDGKLKTFARRASYLVERANYGLEDAVSVRLSMAGLGNVAFGSRIDLQFMYCVSGLQGSEAVSDFGPGLIGGNVGPCRVSNILTFRAQ